MLVESSTFPTKILRRENDKINNFRGKFLVYIKRVHKRAIREEPSCENGPHDSDTLPSKAGPKCEVRHRYYYHHHHYYYVGVYDAGPAADLVPASIKLRPTNLITTLIAAILRPRQMWAKKLYHYTTRPKTLPFATSESLIIFPNKTEKKKLRLACELFHNYLCKRYDT